MVRVLIPSGALGLGYDRAALARGIDQKPDIIAIDGGSTDSGPHYLGTGTSKYSRNSIKAEWRELMQARAEAQVPLIIGTSGTCGADSAVDWLVDITREIAAETGQSLKVAVLKSGQSSSAMKRAYQAGKISPCQQRLKFVMQYLMIAPISWPWPAPNRSKKLSTPALIL